MRYTKPIYFQVHEPGAYDPATGNYGDDVLTETKRWADIMDTSTETLRLIYGELRQGSLTIQLQQFFKGPYDLIRIGDGDRAKYYKCDFERKLRFKQTFVVSEVQ